MTGGYEAPGEAEIDTRALLVALRAAAVSRGVELHEGRVAGLLLEGDRCAGARLEGGEGLRAPRTLAALGARLGGEVLPPEVRPPIPAGEGGGAAAARRFGRRSLRAGDCQRAGVRGAARERRCGDRRDDGGPWIDLRVTAGGVHELLREAYRAVPEVAELELLECRAGLRPTTPDNLPVVGASTIGGLHLAGGHHRHGIMLAPVTADAVAAELTGGELPAPAAAMRPGRFAARLEEETA